MITSVLGRISIENENGPKCTPIPEFSARGCFFPSGQPQVTGISTTRIEIMGRVSAFRSPARFEHLHRTHIVLGGRAILYSALLPRVQVPRRFHDKSRSDTDGSIDAYAVSHRNKRETLHSDSRLWLPRATLESPRPRIAPDASGSQHPRFETFTNIGSPGKFTAKSQGNSKAMFLFNNERTDCQTSVINGPPPIQLQSLVRRRCHELFEQPNAM